MIWIDVEDNPSHGCSWDSYSHQQNCAYLVGLIAQLKAAGKNVGVYTSNYEWGNVMGYSRACPQAATVPLWYAHFDNVKSFSDYKQISNWVKPSIKQYKGLDKVCGVVADLNFY